TTTVLALPRAAIEVSVGIGFDVRDVLAPTDSALHEPGTRVNQLHHFPGSEWTIGWDCHRYGPLQGFTYRAATSRASPPDHTLTPLVAFTPGKVGETHYRRGAVSFVISCTNPQPVRS